MDSDSSILDLISDKEEALKKETGIVCIEAESIVAEAKKKAALILEIAEQEGRREADLRYQDQMQALFHEIRSIREEGERRSAAIRKKGEENLPRAIALIIDSVTGC